MAKEKHKKPKKIGVRLILAWIFGVLFLIGGVVSLFDNFFGSLLVILGAILILPPFGDFVETKFNVKLSGWLKLILFIVLVVMGTSFIGSDEVSSAEVKPIEKVPDKEEVKTYSIGDSINAGDFTWKITGVSTRSEIGEYFAGTFMGEKADGIFVILDLEVENTGNTAKYLSDSYVKLVDSQSREFSANTVASIYLKPQGSSLAFEEINPGITKKGKIVYDVPKDVKIFDVKITSSLFSSETYNIKITI